MNFVFKNSLVLKKEFLLPLWAESVVVVDLAGFVFRSKNARRVAAIIESKRKFPAALAYFDVLQAARDPTRWRKLRVREGGNARESDVASCSAPDDETRGRFKCEIPN